MKPAAKQETMEWRNTDACAPAVVVVVMVVLPKARVGGRRHCNRTPRVGMSVGDRSRLCRRGMSSHRVPTTGRPIAAQRRDIAIGPFLHCAAAEVLELARGD